MFFYKTSSKLIIFHFNIHGKLSMRYITIPFLHIYCLCVILLYNNTYLKGVKKKYNLNQFKYLKILEIDPIVILVFDEACKDLSIDTLTRFLTQSLPIWHKKRQTRQTLRHDGSV